MAISASSVPRFLLRAEARLTLRRQSPRVVIVTGSAGKSSAKDLIEASVGQSYTVRKSGEEGNQLLLMAILGQPPLRYSASEAARAVVRGAFAPFSDPYPEWLVLEVDASAPGRSSSAGRLLHPEIVVFTSLGDVPAHLDSFPSRDHLVEETTSIGAFVRHSGVLVVNADDAELYAAVVRSSAGRRVIGYGFGPRCEVRAAAMEPAYVGDRPQGLLLDIEAEGALARIRLPGVVGRPHAYAAMAAIAVGHALSMPVRELGEVFASISRRPGRLRLLDGCNDAVLIDDTWNPSPDAWMEALRALDTLRCGGRKIVIAAGMAGLGDREDVIHEKLGREAAGVADMVVPVGVWGEAIARGAREAGMDPNRLITKANPLEAADHIGPILAPGDLVLVTAGSSTAGIGMEEAVGGLLLRPDMRKELLVRQTPWWRPGS